MFMRCRSVACRMILMSLDMASRGTYTLPSLIFLIMPCSFSQSQCMISSIFISNGPQDKFAADFIFHVYCN